MLKLSRPYDKAALYCKTLRLIYTTEIRPSSKTHYEILNLNRGCTSKEIKDAFIKLSKQVHPDKNLNNPQYHKRFVKINEAYSVLSRPKERSVYDLSLINEQQAKRSQTSYNSHPSNQTNTVHVDPYKFYNFWKPEYKHTQSDQHCHKKLSKSWIVLLCVIFASVGVGMQILAIRNSMTFSRDKLDKMTEENSRILSELRNQANQNSFEKQVELMKEKLENSLDQCNQSKRIDK